MNELIQKDSNWKYTGPLDIDKIININTISVAEAFSGMYDPSMEYEGESANGEKKN